MHTFNLYGWYSGASDPQRDAVVAPSNLSTSDAIGAMRANWTGAEWVEMPYRVPAPVMPTVEEYTVAIQAMLDAEARTRNYDGILSLASYAASTNPPFAAEGDAGLDWRDAVWLESYRLMALVQTGQMPQPTIEELLAMLPAMVWPT